MTYSIYYSLPIKFYPETIAQFHFKCTEYSPGTLRSLESSSYYKKDQLTQFLVKRFRTTIFEVRGM